MDNDKSSEIGLFANPLQTGYYLTLVAKEKFAETVLFFARHTKTLIFLFVYALLCCVDSPVSQNVEDLNTFFKFCGYWVGLGIASSVGLGTGLHTFVLYLGPHIAKVVMAAEECSTIPEMTPSRWNFKGFLPCEEGEGQVTFIQLLLSVQLESFLWGFGTAIGELPPYFAARAATLAGHSSDDLEEIEELKKTEGNTSYFDKAKVLIHDHLKEHDFITILICASIPNPLFDIAGITCGKFLIPFWTFFGATAIGKSVIKVHIQVIFVIIVFSKEYMTSLVSLIEGNFPSLEGVIVEALEKQKAKLWQQDVSSEEEKSIIAKIWEVVITLMILFFLKGMVEGLANQKKRQLFEESKQK